MNLVVTIEAHQTHRFLMYVEALISTKIKDSVLDARSMELGGWYDNLSRGVWVVKYADMENPASMRTFVWDIVDILRRLN